MASIFNIWFVRLSSQHFSLGGQNVNWVKFLKFYVQNQNPKPKTNFYGRKNTFKMCTLTSLHHRKIICSYIKLRIVLKKRKQTFSGGLTFSGPNTCNNNKLSSCPRIRT